MSTHNPGGQSDVSLTVTSKPVEDETPINIDAKSDSQNIKFHDHAQVGIFKFLFSYYLQTWECTDCYSKRGLQRGHHLSVFELRQTLWFETDILTTLINQAPKKIHFDWQATQNGSDFTFFIFNLPLFYFRFCCLSHSSSFTWQLWKELSLCLVWRWK